MNAAASPRLTHPVRHWFVLGLLLAAFVLLALRSFYLQVVDAGYLKAQGNARHLRVVEVAANRGMILDRNGEPLAISTPVDSVWANPAELIEAKRAWPALARLLETTPQELAALHTRHAGREFMYLKRHVAPELAQRIMDLNLPGVALQREYRRYYPAGAVFGHVLGFTNVDDEGQEGLELAYNAQLQGLPGKKRVLKDRLGHVVQNVQSIKPAVDGKDVVIGLDSRIQYLAYRELKSAVAAHKARGGSVIVLDTKTGEVLAMVNEPGFNPNNRSQLHSALFRNRVVTDVLEPGSTLKPFTIAMALDSGRFGPDTRVDVSGGAYQIGKHTIKDTHDYGLLTVSRVLVKSSNVGASKIALTFEPQYLWQMFQRIGFGAPTASGLPGEAAGRLLPFKRWGQAEQATMSFGYGISVTPLQLARAYTALANDGVLMPVSLLPVAGPVSGTNVMSAVAARQVRKMLELAASEQGTGGLAQVPRYRVAGKTGTVHKLAAGAYAEDRYVSLFAGFAPATNPRLVTVVVIDEPGGGTHFGGEVAAPVFSRVMAGALRLLNVAPDAPLAPDRKTAHVPVFGEAA